MYEKLKELDDARAEYIELFKGVLETLLDSKLVKEVTSDNIQIELEFYAHKSKELYDKIEKLKLEAEIESEDNSISILFENGLIKKINTFTRNNLPLEILKELMFKYVENGNNKTTLTKEHYKKIVRAIHILERTEKKKHRTEPQIGL